MNDDPRTPAWLEAGAVLVAMALTAVGLSAVFADVNWLPPVLVSVFLIVAVGALFRGIPALRASGTAVVAQCVVGVLTVLVLCVPQTLLFGFIPTGRSFVGGIDLLSTGVSDLYATTPPAPSTPGFTAMLVIAFTLITILIDGLVADLRAPKVSGVLLLVLWMIPVFFAPAQVRWWHVAAILTAFLLLMLSPYFASSRWRGGLTALVAGALAVAIGLGMPTLLPQVPTIENRASGNQADLTVTNPFLDLRADLGNRDDAKLFSYSTTAKNPPPVRLTSIDAFDGQNWTPSPFTLDPFAIAAEGLPWPQGLPRDKNYSEQSIDVTIGDYDQQYLPTPYAPQQPSGLNRRWIYDENSLAIVGNGERTAGLKYSMDYLSVEPSAKDLQSATPVDSGDFETELEVPASLPQSVRDTADEVTAGAENQWEAAVLLQAYFRSGEFEYSLDAPEQASGDAISDFLVDKKGYCVQFSSAMTIMARTMGIPARIGVGFAGGDKSGDEYEVSMKDSHAWPELYFEGAGWVRFEPTPGGPAGAPPQWSVASGDTGEESEDAEETASPTEEPTEDASEPPAAESEAPSEEPTTAAAEETGADYTTYLWAALIAVVVILLLAIPAIWRVLQRRRRTGSPVDLEHVWAEIRALATDYGQSLDPSRTLRFNELVLVGKVTGDASADGDGASIGATGADGTGTATGAESAGSALESLQSPLPTLVRPHRDSALASFIDALEAQRYGSRDEDFSTSEGHAVVDEVKTALSDSATPGKRISAVIWPASVFDPPN
ncbi:transglutaminaseTgpA domain-containing protein [Brevibacterium sp.]|uniref:transglutaminase family protein n=1 Tax=Brevibacterium sp. TaxID=1701 RepID=UPI002811AAE0|nr:transglutaminaseTgpA domain-containing protein [Brevibacterium sp.]